ncbi:MAG: helix-hairpin-helix domain-containing protein [Bacteroidota bacterium]
MKRLFHEFTYLTRGERSALLTVSFLLLLALAGRVYVNRLPPGLPPDTEETARIVAQWRLEREKPVPERNSYPTRTEDVPLLFRPRSFDPNTVHADSLLAMGLPPRVVANMVRYREAGGVFRSPGDIGRIYGMDPELAGKLQPFLELNNESPTVPAESKTVPPTELNIAGKDELLALPGIGEVFADRILRYRDRLGGFLRREQLLEVYGMDSVRYLLIESRITADSSLVCPLDLNSAGYARLAAHPYLTEADAGAILSYRRFKGRITDPAELLTQHLLADSTWKKAAGYFTSGSEN